MCVSLEMQKEEKKAHKYWELNRNINYYCCAY
jgi:hypothetical protein